MTITKELRAMFDQADAEEALYTMFRQGLIDNAALPEVSTEAGEAAHVLLGCHSFSALHFVYGGALDVRETMTDADGPVADAIEAVADAYLREQVAAVVAMRGPVGSIDDDCTGAT